MPTFIPMPFWFISAQGYSMKCTAFSSHGYNDIKNGLFELNELRY